jgi:hypothetical protein
MNSKLLRDLGECVLQAQVLELFLSILLQLETEGIQSTANDLGRFADRLATIRADCYISTLARELKELKVPESVLVDIDRAAARRNHLVHRIIHDSGFLRALDGTSPYEDLHSDLQLFQICSERVAKYFAKRSAALGIPISAQPVSSLDQICGLADALLNGIQHRRGRKK